VERKRSRAKEKRESKIYCRSCKQYREVRIEKIRYPVPPELWEIPSPVVYGPQQGDGWAYFCETCDTRISDCTQEEYKKFSGKKP